MASLAKNKSITGVDAFSIQCSISQPLGHVRESLLPPPAHALRVEEFWQVLPIELSVFLDKDINMEKFVEGFIYLLGEIGGLIYEISKVAIGCFYAILVAKGLGILD